MAGWRRRRMRSASQYPAGSAGKRAEIVGVTIDPRHDLASGGTGLYEFWTDQGVPVRLHDTDLVSVELRPIDRVLILQFEYAETQWTPREAVRTPMIVMRFEAVTIREWEQHSVEMPGQVDDFEYDDVETFRLASNSFVIGFTASRLTITTEPRH